MSLKLRPILFIGQLKLFYQHLKTINAWHIPTAMSATLSGSVTMQGGRKNLVIRFFTPGTDTEVAKYAKPLDATGAFTITGITAGTYDVGVKCDSSLSLLATAQVFTEGNTTNIAFGTLLQGDLTGNDKVDGSDYTLLSGNYNKVGPCFGYAGNWLIP
jgi:hypothetical protein